MPTRVIVQYRSHSLLEVLAGTVAAEPGMRLVGVAHNGTEALRLCQREHPDVAVIEADPSGWDAPALASDEDWRAVRELGARIVLVVPDEVDQTLAVEAVLRGADALLPAAQAPGRLLETVELAASGHTLVDPALIRTLLDALRLRLADRATPLDLTARERQILTSIDRGDSVKQTARALGISIKTVESLQHRLFRKLGVRNRAEAVAAAHSRQLLAPPEGVT